MESAANVLNIVNEVISNAPLGFAAESVGYFDTGDWYADRTSDGKAWELVRRVEGNWKMVGTFDTAEDALRVVAVMRACEVEFMAGRGEDIARTEWDGLGAWYAWNTSRACHTPYTGFVRHVLAALDQYCVEQAKTLAEQHRMWCRMSLRIN